MWTGLVKCPNCGCPLDSGTSVCPYCYSSSPHSAPWRIGSFGEWWWQYVPIFILGGIMAVAIFSDLCFGTKWMPALLETVNGWLGDSK